jgi:hypothetical protein
MSQRCVTTMLTFLLIAIPFTVVGWRSFWMVRQHWRVLAIPMHERQAVTSIPSHRATKIWHSLNIAVHHALGAAISELDDTLYPERETIRHRLLQYKDRLENEFVRRKQQIRRRVQNPFDACGTGLQDDLKATAVAPDEMTILLLSLVQQLFSERKRYLADSHITELDLVRLNNVLAVKGLRIRAEFRHSERQVTCTLKNGVGQRTVFWLETATPGVAVEGDGDGNQGEA